MSGPVLRTPHCKRCRRGPLAWTAKGADEGALVHRGRNLCVECYEEARYVEELHLYPRINRRWDETAAEAERIRRDAPHLSWAVIAERMCMSPAALDKARQFARAHGGRPTRPVRERRRTRPEPRRARHTPTFDLVDTEEL